VLLSLVLIGALGFGTVNVGIAVGVTGVAGTTRLMRAQVLRARGATYVEAAIICGTRWWRLLPRYILPDAIGPVLALAALDFGLAVLAVSSLSFLGYGEPPPSPEWGALISDGRDYLTSAWWLTALPGLTVAAVVLAANRLSRSVENERSLR
jgi:peptide/nickel transport system permease protein